MLKRSLHCAIALAGMAALAPQAARADGKASLIHHSAVTAQWKVTKVCPESKGKCKIYDSEPEYDKNLKITNDPVATLKQEGDTFTFESVPIDGKDYWVVFYPSLGNVAVKLEFERGNDTRKATTTSLLVDGLYTPADTWLKGPAVTFTTKAGAKAKIQKENVLKGFSFLSKPPKTFLTLD